MPVGLSDEMIAKTIEAIKTAQATSGDLSKATTSGLTTGTALRAYDLEIPAKNLYPVLAPLRKRISRKRASVGSNAVNWKVVTGIAQGGTSMFVSEGARNQNIKYTEADKAAAYKSWGLDDKVTWEAEVQGRGFEDLRARSSMSLMQLVMMLEEDAYIGAWNSTGAAGLNGGNAVSTPTVTNAGTGGTIGAGTYNVICVALPHLGYQGAGLAALPSYYSKKSSAGSTTTSGSTSTISASVTAVPGAVAYAWFVGTAGNEKLEAITTINSVKLTALAGTGAAASGLNAADVAEDANAFDGIITQLVNGGGYAQAMATGTAGTGTGLTYDNAGGIVEIDNMLKSMWDNARVSPEVILMNSQEALNLDKKIMTAGGQPIFQLIAPVGSDVQQGLVGGVKVVRYINKFTNGTVELTVHPTCAPGTILALTFQLPEWYIKPEIDTLWDVYLAADYTEFVYGQTLRQYEHGVYCHGVLRGFMPAANGIIYNIGNA